MTREEIKKAIRKRIIEHNAQAIHWRQRWKDGSKDAKFLEQASTLKAHEGEMILELFGK